MTVARATMAWASALSREADAGKAGREAGESIAASLGEGPVDLCLAFFSPEHLAQAEAIALALRETLAPNTLAAVSARGIVAGAHELEEGPALSVIAARLPAVEVSPFVLMSDVWRDPVESEAAFDQLAPGARGAELVLLFGDPYSLDSDRVLALFQRFAPGVRVVGGFASAGARPRGNAVVLNEWISAEGGVAIALHGALRADVVVSQGCAPIGPPLDVTHVEDNVILTLDGQPALERAEQVLRELPEQARESLRHGLYVGRPVRGDATGRGDYLIRNLLGADRDRGALAVADRIGPREKIRLHLRDARTASDDLGMLLLPQLLDTPGAAALVFSCNGRGRDFFGRPDHDAAAVAEAIRGATAIAGMFCAGEIGPVGGRNYVHGHTASIAILRPR